MFSFDMVSKGCFDLSCSGSLVKCLRALMDESEYLLFVL